jgi:uncharacterized protein YbjT (DUF2867 family)
MNIILPGGSGLLGRAFASFAQEHGYQCLILTRKRRHADDASGMVMKLFFYIYIHIYTYSYS